MTKQEFTEEQVLNLKKILHKGISVWCERNKVDTKRITEHYSISQNKLGIDIHSNFVIEPEKKE